MTQAPTLPPRPSSPEGQPQSHGPEKKEEKIGLRQRIGRGVLALAGKKDREPKVETRTGTATIGTAFGGGLLAAAIALGPNMTAPSENPGIEVIDEDPGLGEGQGNPDTGNEEEPVVERYENSDFERTEIPADLEALDSMSVEEFKAQPKNEQLRWASWAGQFLPEFRDYFYAVNPLAANDPYTLGPDSDPLTLIEHDSLNMRVSASFGEGTPTSMDYNGPLDRVRIEKYITAHVASGPASQHRIDDFMKSVGVNGQAINVVAQASANIYDYRGYAEDFEGFAPYETTMNIDGTTYEAYRVSFPIGDNGVIADYTIGVVPYTNYLNQPAYDTVVE